MITRTEKNKTEREKIIREEKLEKTKKYLLKFLKYFLVITLTILTLSIYIYQVSTNQLIIREYSKTYEKLPDAFHCIKSVQFGDLYYDNNYLKILDELINKTTKFKPDIILFTGGLIHRNYTLSDDEKNNLVQKLSELDASIGKYFVISHTDDEQTVEILTKSNFKFLDDQSETIYYQGQTPILLSGINQNTKINYSKYKNLFNIVIVNDSKKIDEIIELNNPSIIMSGQNLNGQIRIPYYGALINHNEYTNEYYNLNDIDIFITGGIGTNNIPLRLFNHPSINFYRLRAV